MKWIIIKLLIAIGICLISHLFPPTWWVGYMTGLAVMSALEIMDIIKRSLRP